VFSRRHDNLISAAKVSDVSHIMRQKELIGVEAASAALFFQSDGAFVIYCPKSSAHLKRPRERKNQSFAEYINSIWGRKHLLRIEIEWKLSRAKDAFLNSHSKMTRS